MAWRWWGYSTLWLRTMALFQQFSSFVVYMNAYLWLSCSLINYMSSGHGSAGQERGVGLVPLAGTIWSTCCSTSKEIHEGTELLSVDALVSGSLEVYEVRISKACTYIRWLGTDYASSSKGHIFINGKYLWSTMYIYLHCICRSIRDYFGGVWISILVRWEVLLKHACIKQKKKW